MSFDAYVGEVGTAWPLQFRVARQIVSLDDIAEIALVVQKPGGGAAVTFDGLDQFDVTDADAGEFTFSPSTGQVDTASDGDDTWILQPVGFRAGERFYGDPITWDVGP